MIFLIVMFGVFLGPIVLAFVMLVGAAEVTRAAVLTAKGAKQRTLAPADLPEHVWWEEDAIAMLVKYWAIKASTARVLLKRMGIQPHNYPTMDAYGEAVFRASLALRNGKGGRK